jgi:putative Holliday junction resolvase
MGQMAEPSFVSALGLDVGRKRIGVAGCDGTGLLATGLTTIYRQSFKADLAHLKALVEERNVQVLVVGLPYKMDGELGSQAQQVQRFARGISQALGLPVDYVDERLTSHEAEQLIQQQGRSPSQNKGLIDRKAAAIILQQWLDNRRGHSHKRLTALESTVSDEG